jgi:hypothetical protein
MAKKKIIGPAPPPPNPPDPKYTDIGFRETYWARVKPDIAWAEIQRIKAMRNLPKDEMPGPDVLIQESIDPDSPLHVVFEWDDSKAAHQYRLEQGRKLLRNIVAWVESPTTHEPTRITPIINVNDDLRGQHYYEAKEIARSPRQSLIYQLTLLKSIRSSLHRAAEWSKLKLLFTGFIAQIDELAATIEQEIDAISDPLGKLPNGKEKVA